MLFSGHINGNITSQAITDAKQADTLKSRSSDLQNNIFSAKIEIEKLHRNIKGDTISSTYEIISKINQISE